jgi:hypothetical protein
LGKQLFKVQKPRTTQCANSKNKPNQIKGKEEAIEIDQMANLVEEESKENEFENNLDFF